MSSKYNIQVQKPHIEYPQTVFRKAEIVYLPLSLEDGVQSCGAAAILKQFAKQFDIPVMLMRLVIQKMKNQVLGSKRE